MRHDEREENEKLEKILEFGWKLMFSRMQDSRMTLDQIKRVCEAAEAEISKIESEPNRPLASACNRERGPVQ